jgi:hypothetical protein
MSYDLGVWFLHKPMTNDEATKLYVGLCKREVEDVAPHPSVEAFYRELTAKHPEIDTIPEDRLDDHDYCPWSCALDHSAGHVIISCVWSKAEYVNKFVKELARKHGLAVYDPQSSKLISPNGPADKPWWKFW